MAASKGGALSRAPRWELSGAGNRNGLTAWDDAGPSSSGGARARAAPGAAEKHCSSAARATARRASRPTTSVSCEVWGAWQQGRQRVLPRHCVGAAFAARQRSVQQRAVVQLLQCTHLAHAPPALLLLHTQKATCPPVSAWPAARICKPWPPRCTFRSELGSGQRRGCVNTDDSGCSFEARTCLQRAAASARVVGCPASKACGSLSPSCWLPSRGTRAKGPGQAGPPGGPGPPAGVCTGFDWWIGPPQALFPFKCRLTPPLVTLGSSSRPTPCQLHMRRLLLTPCLLSRAPRTRWLLTRSQPPPTRSLARSPLSLAQPPHTPALEGPITSRLVRGPIVS